MPEPMIECEGVKAQFGPATIYEDLTFRVERGEFLCILGPSGCGKSTTLRLIGDLIPASGGTIRVGGEPPHAAWEKIAYVFQSPRLLPWRSALDNVVLSMEMRYGNMSQAEMRARAHELLRLVGLAADVAKYPRMLSGGERQRVAIARALAVDPEIILMDEPFSALDVTTRTRLRLEIVSIWQQTGKTIVFVTHDIDEALVVADRILLLSGKPSRVVETLRVEVPRPRVVDDVPVLRHYRQVLHELFGGLQQP